MPLQPQKHTQIYSYLYQTIVKYLYSFHSNWKVFSSEIWYYVNKTNKTNKTQYLMNHYLEKKNVILFVIFICTSFVSSHFILIYKYNNN